MATLPRPKAWRRKVMRTIYLLYATQPNYQFCS